MPKMLTTIDEWKQKKGKTVPDGGVTQAIVAFRAQERKVKTAQLSSMGDLIDLHNAATDLARTADATYGKCKPAIHKESMAMLAEISRFANDQMADYASPLKAGRHERIEFAGKGKKALLLLNAFVANPGQQTGDPAVTALTKIAVAITRQAKVLHDAKGLLPLRDKAGLASDMVKRAADKSYSPAAIAEVRKAATALKQAIAEIPTPGVS